MNALPRSLDFRRQARSGRWSLLLVAGLLTGCASDASKPDDQGYQLKLDTDTALKRGSLDNKPLVSSALGFKAPDQLLSYDASYQLNPGAGLLTRSEQEGESAAASAGAPGNLFAGESLGQRLGTRLPFFEAPLLLGVQDRYQGALAPGGLSSTRSANLKWSPAIAKLGLQWQSPDPTAPQPLGCSLDGSLELPGKTFAAGNDDLLKLSGRDCRVFAPDRGVTGFDVAAFSALWQWRGGAGDSAVNLTMIEPQGGAPASETTRASGYELGASRTQTRGALSTKTSVAVRRASDPSRDREQISWTARTTVTRQFDSVAVSASLQHANDPLWFVPASESGGNSFELGFDFKRWIDRQLSTQKVGMGLLWSWTEPPVSGQPIDARVLWTLSIFR